MVVLADAGPLVAVFNRNDRQPTPDSATQSATVNHGRLKAIAIAAQAVAAEEPNLVQRMSNLTSDVPGTQVAASGACLISVSTASKTASWPTSRVVMVLIQWLLPITRNDSDQRNRTT
jgi:hypothetical protein